MSNIDDIGGRIVMKFGRKTGNIERLVVRRGVRAIENIERRIGRRFVRGIGYTERHTVNSGVSTIGNTTYCIHEPRLVEELDALAHRV